MEDMELCVCSALVQQVLYKLDPSSRPAGCQVGALSSSLRPRYLYMMSRKCSGNTSAPFYRQGRNGLPCLDNIPPFHQVEENGVARSERCRPFKCLQVKRETGCHVCVNIPPLMKDTAVTFCSVLLCVDLKVSLMYIHTFNTFCCCATATEDRPARSGRRQEGEGSQHEPVFPVFPVFPPRRPTDNKA